MKPDRRRTPLFVVRLERNKHRFAEHVLAETADKAMRAATDEHPGHEVLSVERIVQVGVRALDRVLVA